MDGRGQAAKLEIHELLNAGIVVLMKPLSEKVAVVAGATRGAGRGIARMLGEAGATVYCTGRSSRTQPNTSGHHYAGRPETIEETAEMVDAAGGVGIPVRVDHTIETDVVALFKRIKHERNRLDILVNVLTGPPVKAWSPFWKLSLDDGRAMLDNWVWPHVATCRHAVPLLVARKAGLLVEIVEGETIGYHGQFFFDLVETSLKRIAHALAEELAPRAVTALAITPGFMRTEAILEEFGASEANWRDAAENNAQAKRFGFIPRRRALSAGRLPPWPLTPRSHAGPAECLVRGAFPRSMASPTWTARGPTSGRRLKRRMRSHPRLPMRRSSGGSAELRVTKRPGSPTTGSERRY
jgi:NAD(P)-dependent dehydrogenase (short-subunit alcohol dehydrogenase family)